MSYSKAATHIGKALAEMIDMDSMTPWQQIEKELKATIMKDDTATNLIMMMSDGILASLSVGALMLESVKDREEQDKQAHMVMLEIISTSMLRAFAMGVHCQRVAAEVETLETLARQ